MPQPYPYKKKRPNFSTNIAKREQHKINERRQRKRSRYIFEFDVNCGGYGNEGHGHGDYNHAFYDDLRKPPCKKRKLTQKNPRPIAQKARVMTIQRTPSIPTANNLVQKPLIIKSPPSVFIQNEPNTKSPPPTILNHNGKPITVIHNDDADMDDEADTDKDTESEEDADADDEDDESMDSGNDDSDYSNDPKLPVEYWLSVNRMKALKLG